MSFDDPCGHEGPIEEEAKRLLADVLECTWSAQMSLRSPIGPGAIKLQIEGDTDRCGELLQGQSWIEEVAVRPRHIYLRIETEAMRSWIDSRYPADLGAVQEHPGATRLVCAGAARPDSLRAFRCGAVAAALAGVLASRGYDVSTGSEVETQSAAIDEPGSIDVHDGPTGDGAARVPVGSIDVRYGSLRMRSGGMVSVDDAESELAIALAAAMPGRSAEHCAGGAKSALALAMLATPRAKHLCLDERWVQQAASNSARIAGSLSEEAASNHGRDDAGAGGDKHVERIRELAIELDGLHWQLNRAASELEPAHLARFATTVAIRLEKVGLVDEDPLRTAGSWAIGAALNLLQIGWPSRHSAA